MMKCGQCRWAEANRNDGPPKDAAEMVTVRWFDGSLHTHPECTAHADFLERYSSDVTFVSRTPIYIVPQP
jgi:hypothetical protein